jgi:hypothetical protein
VSRWFDPPPSSIVVAAHELRFDALVPATLHADYAAVMRDIAMLRRWSGEDWPTATFTLEENLADLVRHDREQRDGEALTYSVVQAETVVGCIYARPLSAALSTRDTVAPNPLPIPAHDAVVRGWAHDIPATTLVAASLEAVATAFATGSPADHRRCWWITNLDCPEQLAACDTLGLHQRHAFVGPTATWVVCGMAE